LVGKSVTETLALLTLAYGEYPLKKSSVLEWHKRLKERLRDVQDNPRSKQPKMQRTVANVDRVRTLMRSERRLGVRLIAEGFWNLFEAKDPTRPDKWILHYDNAPEHVEFASSWLRNPLQKSTIHLNHLSYLLRCFALSKIKKQNTSGAVRAGRMTTGYNTPTSPELPVLIS
jgi:hypothetical protein